MRLLAVSYVLPPMLYPQSIQIGRLLMHVPGEIGLVSGRIVGGGLECYGDLVRKAALHVEVPFAPRLTGFGQGLARKFLPFYGRIPDEYRRWVALAERATASRLLSGGFQPEVMATFGEPMSDHLLGLRLKRKFGFPWIAHFSDPWADNPFRRRELLANIVNRRDEREVITESDAVIFTSQETLDMVMAKYASQRAKASVLPHSFDSSLYAPSKPKQGPLVVRYIGAFYGKRTPYSLFKALGTLLDRMPEILEGVRFELIGRVPTVMTWHSSFRRLPEGMVTVVGTIPYIRSLQMMTEADLLLVMDAPDDISVFLPSKLIDYLGSGTPIMGIVPPGASHSLLNRLGAVTANPREPEQVVAGLVHAIKAARERRLGVMEPWGNTEVRREFNPLRAAQEFRKIAADLIASAG